eukprot:778738-Pelagomonas_calceolata.AAC.3
MHRQHDAGSEQLQVDLKGAMFDASVLPLAGTALVVNIGPSEAKEHSMPLTTKAKVSRVTPDKALRQHDDEMEMFRAIRGVTLEWSLCRGHVLLNRLLSEFSLGLGQILFVQQSRMPARLEFAVLYSLDTILPIRGCMHTLLKQDALSILSCRAMCVTANLHFQVEALVNDYLHLHPMEGLLDDEDGGYGKDLMVSEDENYQPEQEGAY